MKIVATSSLGEEEKKDLIALWNVEYPEQLRFENPVDFDDYVSGLYCAIHYLLRDFSGDLIGWAFKFKRENDTWFAVIVHSRAQHAGYGRLLLQELTSDEKSVHGWVVDHDHYVKINGETYRSPLEFYLKNGFVLLPGRRLENAQLSAALIRWTASAV